VHAHWEWPGFTDPSAAGPVDRAGHITMVMTRQSDGRWLIRASQNTNRV
jgi:ketosteroid isomerase-like protein